MLPNVDHSLSVAVCSMQVDSNVN